MSHYVRELTLPAAWSEIHKLKNIPNKSIFTVRLWVGCCVAEMSVALQIYGSKLKQPIQHHNNTPATSENQQKRSHETRQDGDCVTDSMGLGSELTCAKTQNGVKRKMPALVSAPHLSQTEYVSTVISHVCLNTLWSTRWMEFVASWTAQPDDFPAIRCQSLRV